MLEWADLEVLSQSIALAVSTFNGGATALWRVLEETGLHVGIFSSDFFVAEDSTSIKNAQRQASQATHKARRAKKRKRLCPDEQQEEAESFPYMTGGH